jgi:hypothetical protein
MFLDRHQPSEGIFTNGTDWANLVAAVDSTGRPLMPYISPVNANGPADRARRPGGHHRGRPDHRKLGNSLALNEIVPAAMTPASGRRRSWTSA